MLATSFIYKYFVFFLSLKQIKSFTTSDSVNININNLQTNPQAKKICLFKLGTLVLEFYVL